MKYSDDPVDGTDIYSLLVSVTVCEALFTFETDLGIYQDCKAVVQTFPQ